MRRSLRSSPGLAPRRSAIAAEALCDGGQAMTLEELPRLMEYVGVVRKAYREAVDGRLGSQQ